MRKNTFDLIAKRFVLILISIFPFVLLTESPSNKYMCVRVLDGDTVFVMKDKKEVKIKIDGVDCPEMGQAFGKNAKQFTSKLVLGKVVEVSIKGLDNFKTIVAYVMVEKSDVSLELLKAGLAWNYKRFSSDDPIYAMAENDARNSRIGLWSMPNPTSPWDFRNEAMKLLETKPINSPPTSAAKTSKSDDTNKEPEPETIEPVTKLFDYEIKRKIALDELERDIYELSKKANEMDINYTRYRDSCMFKYTYGNISVFTYGRTWFSVWEGNVSISNESTPECRKIWSDFSRLAGEIKTGIENSMEKARKNGVFPGQMRKIREKYYLDWSGWD